MNTGFYKDLDTNFEQALEMSQRQFSHDELLMLLKNGNIPEKQIAALKLEELNSQNEVEILINNLTGCDGKIREAVALKINQLLNKNKIEYINMFAQYPTIFADATIDINANICRLVVDSALILAINKDFADIYLSKLLTFIDETFFQLDKFIFRDKKYLINKQLFKLYWSLEALKIFAKVVDKEQLLKILNRALLEKEYTIREKVAQILLLVNNEEFEQLKSVLKNDDNYYVRQVFKN